MNASLPNRNGTQAPPPGASPQSKSAIDRPSRFDAIALQLARFIQQAKQLEESLGREEDKSARLISELKEAHGVYDRLLREEKTRVTEHQLQVAKATSALQTAQESENTVKLQLHALGRELKEKTEELRRYQNAWNQVLEREREAKQIIHESDKNRTHREDLERRLALAERTIAEERELRKKMENQARNYREELDRVLRSLDSTLTRGRGAATTVPVQSQPKTTAAQPKTSAPSRTLGIEAAPAPGFVAPRASDDRAPLQNESRSASEDVTTDDIGRAIEGWLEDDWSVRESGTPKQISRRSQ